MAFLKPQHGSVGANRFGERRPVLSPVDIDQSRLLG
jgi:hypothetical protein